MDKRIDENCLICSCQASEAVNDCIFGMSLTGELKTKQKTYLKPERMFFRMLSAAISLLTG